MYQKFFFFAIVLFIYSNRSCAQWIDGDSFSKKTVWFNTDYPVAMNQLTEKIAVVVVTDPGCVECEYWIAQLQSKTLRMAEVQMVQIIPGNSDAPLSRQEVLQYIQENKINHPVGVTDQLMTISGAQESPLPYFILYERNSKQALSASGAKGFNEVMKRLDELSEDKDFMGLCSKYVAKPSVEQNWWADPLIENPGYLAINADSGFIAVAEPSHNRIVVMDGSGTTQYIIGSGASGFKDDQLNNSRFDQIHGMTFIGGGKMLIADTYNHKIRLADFSAQTVYNVLGNGTFNANKADTIKGVRGSFGLPVDVELFGKRIILASALQNRLYEFDLERGYAKAFCDLPERVGENRRDVRPLNLSASGKLLYVVMNDGSVIEVDTKGVTKEIFRPATSAEKVTSVYQWKKNLIASVPFQNRIMEIAEGKLIPIAGTGQRGELNSKADSASFNRPFDLATMNGEMLISDRGNFQIRKLTSPSGGRVKAIPVRPGIDIIGDAVAHETGEPVAADTLFLNKSIRTSHAKIKLDLQGYQLDPEGVSAIDMDPLPGVTMVSERITEDFFELDISSEIQMDDIYIEVYLTLRHPEHPEVVIVKRAFLDIPVIWQETGKGSPEIVYQPNLLPG